MKRRLLELLSCPACRGPLELTVLQESEHPVAVPPSDTACKYRCALRGIALAPGAPAPSAAECAGCYGREIDEGVLTCNPCGALYPIVGAVPRLVRYAEQEHADFFDRHRAAIREATGREPAVVAGRRDDPRVFDRRSNESFGLQWLNQAESDKTWFKDDVALRKGEFLYSLGVGPDDMQGALIFDAGCGNGRLTASIADFGAEIVGMDLSASIDRARAGQAQFGGARQHFVHFIQGNVMEPPVRPGAFDMVHSSGVLVATPSVERGLASLMSALRRGGRVYIQLYRKREAWVGIPNAVLRAITTRLPVRLLYRVCWALVPLHTALVLFVARQRGEELMMANASRGERALSLFDNFSPKYQHRYTTEEVRRMFQAAGLVEIKDTTLANEARHNVAFAGRVPETT